MDEINQSYNAFKTILELCKDRNYIVPDDYGDINFETFKYLYLNKIRYICKYIYIYILII